MLRRLLIITASTAVFGCALVSCGAGAESGETLRWRSAVDVPVNFSLPVSFGQLFPGCRDLSSDLLTVLGINDCDSLTSEQDTIVQSLLDDIVAELPEDTCFKVNLGAGTVPTGSDVMDFLRKLTNPEIKYSIGVNKSTNVKFTVYGMFFQTSDSMAMVKDSIFYDMITHNSVNNGRVSVLGTEGLSVNGSDTGCYPHNCGLTAPNTQLNALVIGRDRKSFSWRWLLTLKKSEYESLRNSTVATDTVHIRLRMRFSGENSIDSLFTL
jgi:hypothetical protein